MPNILQNNILPPIRHCLARLPPMWRESFLLLAGFLVFALIHPPNGLGFDFCLMHRLTGLPCPGCGITRSVASLMQGHWRQSLTYHPFGFLLPLGFAGLLLFIVLPEKLRQSLHTKITTTWRIPVRIAAIALATFFLIFGLGRIFLRIIDYAC